MKNTKYTTEVKVGDTIRIVKSKNENCHYYQTLTLCEVIKFYINEDDKLEFEVRSLYDTLENTRFTQYILREDFEVVL